jgi:purine-binding chemotaxis protein CheW
MDFPERIVVFSLDDQRYAVSLAATERVVPAMAITPLPKAPPIVDGVFNLHGRIIPVVNVRRRFGRPSRELSPSNQFIVVRTTHRSLALLVDATEGVVAASAPEVTPPELILPGLPYVRGVLRLGDGLVWLHDLETFLALEEADALDRAVRAQEGAATAP